MILGYTGVITAVVAITNAQLLFNNCDYYGNFTNNTIFYAYNQEYSNSYGRGVSCRWVAESPPDTRILLTCEDINLPSSLLCLGDALVVSLSGSDLFLDGQRYCGQRTLSLISHQNKISVGLFSSLLSNGGRFLCSLTYIRPEPTNCNCGWRQTSRIVGGEETGINEFPSMAALVDIGLQKPYCGASIISQKYALTAAHCVENRIVTTVLLLVGDHDIETGNETNATAVYRIAQFIIHEHYQPDIKINDIALVKTNNSISFSINVGPICLPFYYTQDTFTNKRVTVLGWGDTSFSGPSSNKLLGAQLTVISNQNCNTQYDGTIQSSQMCTYESGKDACQFDSGGPCVFYNTNSTRNYLVGIISYGTGCALNFPGVNTRVTSYLDWIVSKTTDAQYCLLP